MNKKARSSKINFSEKLLPLTTHLAAGTSPSQIAADHVAQSGKWQCKVYNNVSTIVGLGSQ